jgi:hypothetical protein
MLFHKAPRLGRVVGGLALQQRQAVLQRVRARDGVREAAAVHDDAAAVLRRVAHLDGAVREAGQLEACEVRSELMTRHISRTELLAEHSTGRKLGLRGNECNVQKLGERKQVAQAVVASGGGAPSRCAASTGPSSSKLRSTRRCVTTPVASSIVARLLLNATSPGAMPQPAPSDSNAPRPRYVARGS